MIRDIDMHGDVYACEDCSRAKPDDVERPSSIGTLDPADVRVVGRKNGGMPSLEDGDDDDVWEEMEDAESDTEARGKGGKKRKSG